MVPIKNKPNAMKCENHRTISILTHASEIVLGVLTKTLQFIAERDNCIGEAQYGVRKRMSTRDAIAALRGLMEKDYNQPINQSIKIYIAPLQDLYSEAQRQHGRDIHVCFVDYDKAFHRVEI
jgi:hypothetical protein